jgi:hypothetical protein
MQPSSQSIARYAWLLPPLVLGLSGCAAIEGIFKAGVWVGVIAVAFVLLVAFGLVRMLSK